MLQVDQAPLLEQRELWPERAPKLPPEN
jgi:hypothetical protein